jgi:hypothetical protein
MLESRFFRLWYCYQLNFIYNQKLQYDINYFNYEELVCVKQSIDLFMEKQIRFYKIHQRLSQIKEDLYKLTDYQKTTILILEREDLADELKKICEIPHGYPFTLEETLNCIDFLEDLHKKLKNI